MFLLCLLGEVINTLSINFLIIFLEVIEMHLLVLGVAYNIN